ncbi:MAG: macrolide ABC transporter ATP-binding protein, partial [Bacillales bacterium]
PTGALDTKTSRSIMELFARLNEEGTTIVVVTHEPEVAKYAERIIMLRDGEIVPGEDYKRGLGQ